MSLMKNSPELTDLVAGLTEFERQIRQLADRVGLVLTDFYCDHASVRCNTLQTAERWRKGLLACGKLLSEKQINGRPICLFDLNEPLVIAGQAVDCIELPYPGNKTYPLEGWEHIELVIPCEPEQLHEVARAALADRGLIDLTISIKCSKPKGEGEQLANPTLAISDGRVTIKFHPYSIREIIAK